MNHEAAGSTVDDVCAQVAQRIARGQWPGGFALIEVDLCDKLQVSRSTVREALRRLESQGLLVRSRSRNLVVRRLTHRDVAELYEIREQLESYAAGQAARHFDGLAAAVKREWRTQLRWWAHVPAHELEALGDANREFHARLMALGGNSHLPRLLEGTLMTLFVSQFRPWLRGESLRQAAAEHVAILESVVAGDERGAARAMRTHVRSSAHAILALGEEAFEPEAGPA